MIQCVVHLAMKTRKQRRRTKVKLPSKFSSRPAPTKKGRRPFTTRGRLYTPNSTTARSNGPQQNVGASSSTVYSFVSRRTTRIIECWEIYAKDWYFAECANHCLRLGTTCYVEHYRCVPKMPSKWGTCTIVRRR